MRVLIACGGSAGHIFPGLALAEELKSAPDSCRILIIVSAHAKDKRFLAKARCRVLTGRELQTVSTIALPYSFSLKYILFAFSLGWALLKSLIIILRYPPNVAVGLGGYTSFAPLMIARLMGIPTLIHEQNVLPGRANRCLARVVDRIAVSFDQTQRYFERLNLGGRLLKTGLPLRRQILAAGPEKNRRAQEKFTVLVMGGSQGAQSINQLVLDCLPQMEGRLRQSLHLIHLTGEKDFGPVQEGYKQLGVSFQVFDFLENIVCAYRVADLLIGRSGASTIFEAAHFALPCILIPYPYGTSHQQENARYLENNDCAIVLDEKTTTGKELAGVLHRLMKDRLLREKLSQNISMQKTERAAGKLKQEIFALSSRR